MANALVQEWQEDVELSRVSVKDVPPVPLTMVYHQIEISVQSPPKQMVTFDDNGQNNCWGFHPGNISPNISELFHMNWVSEDKNEVEIFGYLPPPSRGQQTKWYLTVLEDGKGVPERHPKFRPEQEVMVMSNQSLHKVFKVVPEDVVLKSGRFALSFQKHYDSRTVYLVPGSRKKIVSKTPRATRHPDPEYPFTVGRNFTSDELCSMNIGWEKIVEY